MLNLLYDALTTTLVNILKTFEKKSRPNNGIKLHGKFLEVLKDFVGSLNYDYPNLWINGFDESPIVKMVANIHKQYLEQDEARNFLTYIIFEHMHKDNLKSGNLKSPANEKNYFDLLNILQKAIESIPRSYLIRFELPYFPTTESVVLKLTENISVHINSESYYSQPSTPQEGVLLHLSSLAGIKKIGENKKICCLEFKVLGYVSKSNLTLSAINCFAKAKIISFLLTNYKLFKNSYPPHDFNITLTSLPENLTAKLNPPQAVTHCFSRLAPEKENLLTIVHQTSEGENVSKLATGYEETVHALEKSFEPIKSFFRSEEQADFTSICAAIEWYQDSRSAENQTFAYLAVCIGLEAILGSDETITELSKRLCDRFAFLLGKSRGDREALAKEYEQVLKVRGRLVHAKVARLSKEDSVLLTKARFMLKATIEHEIRRLYKNSWHYDPY